MFFNGGAKICKLISNHQIKIELNSKILFNALIYLLLKFQLKRNKSLHSVVIAGKCLILYP